MPERRPAARTCCRPSAAPATAANHPCWTVHQRQQLLLGGGGDPVPGEALGHQVAGFGPEPGPERAVRREAGHGLGQRSGIAGRHQQAGPGRSTGKRALKSGNTGRRTTSMPSMVSRGMPPATAEVSSATW